MLVSMHLPLRTPYSGASSQPAKLLGSTSTRVDVLLLLVMPEYQYEYYEHSVMCQYWACTGPMLPASAQYRPGTDNLQVSCILIYILLKFLRKKILVSMCE